MWCILITMTTVGYGDVYPKSFFGRILGIILCIWGVLLVSLFVVTVSEQLELTQLQKNAYVLIQRLSYRDALKEVSASAVYSMFKFSKAIKNKKEGDKAKILNTAEKKFKEKMMIFKNKIIEMRKFDTTVEYTYLSKNLLAFGDYITKYKENQDKTEEQQEKMLEFLKNLLTAKGVDFDQFMQRIEDDEDEKNKLEEQDSQATEEGNITQA
uniref:Potassium channel domain-containing protein n=1 Tax=Euplotes crassus TaxID=5936 RepID=A0A7S3KVW0_EUPCR|mmetsp:Transcript_7951/g.7503  ORF Transcript_7951/g.7503 Transcript_7951/m.7503 type:complete len:211 (+) Transcript_7951:550-1182(+)